MEFDSATAEEEHCDQGGGIVETGAEAFWVAEIARECGHEVRVVPSTPALSLGVGQRRLQATGAMGEH